MKEKHEIMAQVYSTALYHIVNVRLWLSMARFSKVSVTFWARKAVLCLPLRFAFKTKVVTILKMIK